MLELCSKQEKLILEKIAFSARKLNVDAYVIGGFVRDKILQRSSKDIDIVTSNNGIALAQEFASLFKPQAPVSVFHTFGTAQVVTPEFEIEFVGARKESYAPTSRNPTVAQGTLEDDQQRRDFTMNALAISLNKDSYGELIDPFDGIADIEKKIIRTPLDPDITFSDDPLRMMRAIRFATQLNFTIHEETYNAICRNFHRIEIISMERITEELQKILHAKKPSIGFDILYQTKLLHQIFPELVDLAGAEYIDGKGHKDNFYHTLQVVDNICNHTTNIWLRWAALLHDIAKPATKKFEPGIGWTFHGHEWVGSKMVPRIFKRFKLPMNEKMHYVQKLVLLHLRPISLTKDSITDSAVRRLLFEAGNEIDDLMLLCHADITTKNKEKLMRYHENLHVVKTRMDEVENKDQLRNWQPPISGKTIMQTFGLKPSKLVGDIKDAIREAILDGEIENNIEHATAFMHKKAKELNIIS